MFSPFYPPAKSVHLRKRHAYTRDVCCVLCTACCVLCAVAWWLALWRHGVMAVVWRCTLPGTVINDACRGGDECGRHLLSVILRVQSLCALFATAMWLPPTSVLQYSVISRCIVSIRGDSGKHVMRANTRTRACHLKYEAKSYDLCILPPLICSPMRLLPCALLRGLYIS